MQYEYIFDFLKKCVPITEIGENPSFNKKNSMTKKINWMAHTNCAEGPWLSPVAEIH